MGQTMLSILEAKRDELIKVHTRAKQAVEEVDALIISTSNFIYHLKFFDKPLPEIGAIVYQRHPYIMEPYRVDMAMPFEVTNIGIDRHATEADDRIIITLKANWSLWDDTNPTLLDVTYTEFTQDFGNEPKTD